MSVTEDQPTEPKNELVESYLRIRTAIGILAVLLPVVLFASQKLDAVIFAPSISEFYYTPMREVLVGTIGAIAVFLISYKGYPINEARAKGVWTERFLTDRRVSYWAAFGALGVAFFPTFTKIDIALGPDPLVYSFMSLKTAGQLHQISAILFFGALAIFCLSNFRRGEEKCAKDEKENAFYLKCGWVLVACIIALIIIGAVIKFKIWPEFETLADNRHLIFWVEAVGLLTFAVAWLRKGQAITTVPAALRQLVGL